MYFGLRVETVNLTEYFGLQLRMKSYFIFQPLAISLHDYNIVDGGLLEHHADLSRIDRILFFIFSSLKLMKTINFKAKNIVSSFFYNSFVNLIFQKVSLYTKDCNVVTVINMGVVYLICPYHYWFLKLGSFAIGMKFKIACILNIPNKNNSHYISFLELEMGWQN